MFKTLSLIVALLFFTFLSGLCQNIQFFNPSFEGEPRDAITPLGWIGCEDGTTPDILPGPWGVYLPASEGQTYMGLIVRKMEPGNVSAKDCLKHLKQAIATILK